MNSIDPSTDDPRVLHATQEYLVALEAGRRPERTAFMARFPDVRTALEPYLDALDLFHAAGPIAPPSPETAGAEPLGDFRIVRQIGSGGMGTVYEAMQLSLGRRVALKVLPFAAALDAKQLQRFKNEAQAAAQLHHTNIVPVYAVGCERGVHYYAMQLIEGQNLAELIRQLRPMVPAASAIDVGNDIAIAQSNPPTEVGTLAAELSTRRATRSGTFFRTLAGLVIQAADALEHAHQLGVIHRDVKPANLLVDGRANVWVTDFGLAQFHNGAGLTRTGDLLGTLRYMSPEQAAGGAAVDVRTDVYSLGATLYELLALKPMFDGEDQHRLLHQILNDEPKPARAHDRLIPPELETIVLKAVSKNPAERYATAKAFADDLRNFVDNRPIVARRPSVPQRTRKWMRRHPSFVGAGVVLLLLTTAGSLVSAGMIDAARHREQQRAQDAEDQFRLAQQAVSDMIQIGDEELAGNPFLQPARKRLLEAALGYYQKFIEYRQDDPAAKEELRKADKRVKAILSDLAALNPARMTPMFGNKSVAEELHLDGDQRQQIRDMLEAGAGKMMGWGKLPPVERERHLADLFRVEDQQVHEMLSTEQRKRLRQIGLQWQGLAAFRDPEVSARLKLTDKQIQQLRLIETESFFGPPFGKPPGPGGPKGRKGSGPKQQASQDRAFAVLTDEQRKLWRELTGPAFVAAQHGPPFGPPGGFRKGPPPH